MSDLLADRPHRRPRFERAVVLFNAGAYFEAHEDWEELWHEAVGAERRWLQGLIQVAAAFVHFERGFFARGFARLLTEARAKLANYDGPSWNVDLVHLEEALAPWAHHALRVGRGAPLGQGAPPLRPVVRYRSGYRPDPLPVEEGPS